MVDDDLLWLVVVVVAEWAAGTNATSCAGEYSVRPGQAGRTHRWRATAVKSGEGVVRWKLGRPDDKCPGPGYEGSEDNLL